MPYATKNRCFTSTSHDHLARTCSEHTYESLSKSIIICHHLSHFSLPTYFMSHRGIHPSHPSPRPRHQMRSPTCDGIPPARSLTRMATWHSSRPGMAPMGGRAMPSPVGTNPLNDCGFVGPNWCAVWIRKTENPANFPWDFLLKKASQLV